MPNCKALLMNGTHHLLERLSSCYRSEVPCVALVSVSLCMVARLVVRPFVVWVVT